MGLTSTFSEDENYPVNPCVPVISSARARRRRRRREANLNQKTNRNLRTDSHKNHKTNDEDNTIDTDDPHNNIHNEVDLVSFCNNTNQQELLLELPTQAHDLDHPSSSTRAVNGNLCSHGAVPLLSNLHNEIESVMNQKTEVLLERIGILESDLNFIKSQIDNVNSDAGITDENIAMLGCRLTSIENFLKVRGFAMI